MRTLHGDLWSADATWRIIPTNLCVRCDGTAVMGAGVALQAARRSPNLSAALGKTIRNTHIWTHALVFHFPAYALTWLPTKTDWRLPSDLGLIDRGLRQFVADLPSLPEAAPSPIALPLLGCGLGQLRSSDVLPLPDRLLEAFRSHVGQDDTAA
jgi:hypothetical protein